jgi:hypothetical protein
MTDAAVLEIEIAGPIPGTEHDRLNINGPLALGGALRLHLTGGFVPDAAQTFTVITATGGITGSFDQIIPPLDLPPGITLEAAVQGNSVVVTAVATEGYDDFAAAHFSAAELENPAISGPYADPNGNGIANVWEWVLGNDPQQAGGCFDIAAGVEAMDGDRYLIIRLPWRKGVSGVTLGVEGSGNPSAGDWQPVAFDTLRAEDAGDHYLLFLRILDPVSNANQRFFRMTLEVNTVP